MLAIALLATVLVVEAWRAVRTHTATAHQVLIDYAALGAQGTAARLQSAIAPRLFPILSALRELPTPELPPLPERLTAQSAALARTAIWAGRVAREANPSAAIDSSVVPLPEEVRDSLRAISDRLPDAAYFGMLRVADGYVVFSPLRDGPAPVAMLLPNSAMIRMLDEVLAPMMLLPPAIAKGDSLDSGLGASVRDAGRVLAQRGYVGPTPFTARQSLGEMFGGLEVEVRIAEALAPQLVIGGLPRSRVPLLAAILAVTLLLAAGGVIQAQQERRLVRLREDVVAGASHELRTPLAQIRLFAETLRLGRIRSEDERARALAVIEREARRLEHLVDNLLHTSRSDRGGIQLAREQTDLAVLTRQIVDEFAPLAGKAEVQVTVSADQAAMISVDQAAWRQVLVNLLDNAVKYGGRGTVVRVALQTLPESVVVTVSDEGPGVPPADRDKVWRRFWRGDAAAQSGATGSGLGLATVRDLVELHGGRCTVVESNGTGATFRLELPA